MNRVQLSDALSGGYVETYSLDLSNKTFTMHVEVFDEDGREQLSVYDVTFSKCSRFALEDESGHPWERIQVMEVWIEEEPQSSASEEWQVLISLWDTAHLSIRCAGILVNGEPLG